MRTAFKTATLPALFMPFVGRRTATKAEDWARGQLSPQAGKRGAGQGISALFRYAQQNRHFSARFQRVNPKTARPQLKKGDSTLGFMLAEGLFMAAFGTFLPVLPMGLGYGDMVEAYDATHTRRRTPNIPAPSHW